MDEKAQEREDKIYDSLSALGGVDTSEMNLRDHPLAWVIMEKLIDALETEAYASGRDDEREEWAQREEGMKLD